MAKAKSGASGKGVWNGKSMSGPNNSPKGGGSIVETTRNGSMMAQSKGQNYDAKGPNISSASTPMGKKSPGSGGKTGSSGGLSKNFAGSENAGDAGKNVGGGHKLGNIYAN
jgi:hypothetical protein